jgi:hypothetical protein
MGEPLERKRITWTVLRMRIILVTQVMRAMKRSRTYDLRNNGSSLHCLLTRF